MLETCDQRIARMELEKVDRFARAQRYEEAMNTPSLPIVVPMNGQCSIGLKKEEFNNTVIPKSKTTDKPRFNKQLYMRNYMRKRRLAKKQGAK